MYYEDEKLKMIELPYDDNLSMIILLPSEKYNSVIDYIKKEKEDYTLIHNKLKETKNVKLYLPKFKIEYSSSLKESFKKMGMKLAFSTNANLKKLFSDSNLSKNIFIEDILHKTYIKIDEEGTEAASASAVIISKRGGGIEMRVNHSFLYMIKDKRIMDINGNNMMLFIGVINNLQ
jgi:serpin B